MSFAVVLVATGPLAAVMMPTGAAVVAAAHGRHYAVFTARGRMPNVQFINPTDGQLFGSVRIFDSVGRAQSWIERDIAEHQTGVR